MSQTTVTTPSPQTPPAAGPSHEGRAARWFLYSGVFWLFVPGLAGLVMALFLYDARTQEWVPEPLRSAVIFGRLRPLHVNLLLFGWLSMAYAGSILHIVPRLTGAPLYAEPLARLNVFLWNLLVLGAAVSLPLGFTQGREYAELVWPLDLLQLLCFGILAVNVWGTALRRRVQQLYISVWSFMAATSIGPLVYAVGNKVWDPSGAYTGMNDAIMNYFYVHNIFNAWFTTGALGLAFYLLPKLTGNPLFSHRLAIWGFASVWTGQHHLLYGPGPEWLEIFSVGFSILTFLPNAAFTLNYVKTMEGAWHKVRESVALRFLAVGCAFYIVTCLQGIAQSFRGFNAMVHFTNWVIGHSHLAFVADYSFFCFALVYTFVPQLLGRALHSRRLMEWHFWLTLVGLTVFMVDLWVAGLVQGQSWSTGGIPFMETVRAMQPYYLIRLLAGLAVGAGQVCFAITIWKTARGEAAYPALRPGAALA
ncbi:MAG: cbb3-type cytochrome c oxidase subunit I [Chloroflexi bacterium]|nr:cbb3-type cytochrome c oxidase subunit I [Chloroflexota bacterium]